MTIEVNGAPCHIPSDTSQITLGKFIEWQNQYGKALDEELLQIVTVETMDDVLLEFDIDQHIDKEARCWYSFWTGADFFALNTVKDVVPLIDQYKMIRTLLKSSEQEARDIPAEFSFNGETWAIQDHKVDGKSRMTFNEVITSKEVMRQLVKLGQSRWESLIYLSAIFFRKVGEPYTDILIEEGGERMKLFQELPLSYALHVAFFLNSSVTIWLSTLGYSGVAALETAQLN